MDPLTIIIGIIVASVVGLLSAIAIYSLRPTVFEDAVPGYGARAVVDRTTSKTSKKKSKKSNGSKQSSSGGKSTAESGQNEPETDDYVADNASSSEEDNTSRDKTKKPKKEAQPSDEDVDLLAYSRNFKSDLTTKIAAASKTAVAIGSSRAKQEVAKKPKGKEVVEQVIQTTSAAAAVSAKPVPKNEVDSARVADVSRKPTPAQTVVAAAATSTASARGAGQSTNQKTAASSAKPVAVKESAITRNSMSLKVLTVSFMSILVPGSNYYNAVTNYRARLTCENESKTGMLIKIYYVALCNRL